MQDLGVLVKVLETWDLAEDGIAGAWEIEADLSDWFSGLFSKLLVGDSLQEGFADVSCADWPASMGCFRAYQTLGITLACSCIAVQVMGVLVLETSDS